MGNKFPKDRTFYGRIFKNFSFEKVYWYKHWHTSHPLKKEKTIKDIVQSVYSGHKLNSQAQSSPVCVVQIDKTNYGYCWSIAFGKGY